MCYFTAHELFVTRCLVLYRFKGLLCVPIHISLLLFLLLLAITICLFFRDWSGWNEQIDNIFYCLFCQISYHNMENIQLHMVVRILNSCTHSMKNIACTFSVHKGLF